MAHEIALDGAVVRTESLEDGDSRTPCGSNAKLPTTIPKRLEDTPAFLMWPGEAGHSVYGEGVFIGYRRLCIQQRLHRFGRALAGGEHERRRVVFCFRPRRRLG